jgi:hypothetical protein
MSLYVSRPILPVSRLYTYVRHFTESSRWQLKLSLVLFGFVLLTTYPNYLDILADPAPRKTFSYFFDKMATPFSAVSSVDDLTHGAKIAFRLTVPLLARLLNVGFTATGKDVVLVFGLQSLLLIPFLLMLTRLLNRHLDAVSTVLVVVACSATYFVKAFFWDYHFWFDGYAYFFLLGGMYFQRRGLVFLSLLLATWTDERAVVALGGVYLFHRLCEQNFRISTYKELLPSFRPMHASSVVVLVVLAYGLGRWWLSSAFGLSTPSGQQVGVSLSLLPYQFKHRLVGILFSFEGLWIVVLLVFFGIWQQSQRWIAAFLTGLFLLHIVVAYSVYDITRSLSYAFPLVIISLVLFGRAHRHTRQHYFLLSMFLSLLIPTHYVIYNILQIPWTIFSLEEFRFILQHV